MPVEVKTASPGDVVSGQIPNWMDSSFFQRALREGGEDPKIRVADCEVCEATSKGENYVSIVYRALVKDEAGKEHHLIVKCLPSNEARKIISNKASFFRKEIDMYGVVFPAYEGLHSSSRTSPPWPKHYFSVLNGDCDYLVMEDLKKSGFVLRERLKGLDRNHLEAALSALARYHAYSYALKVRDHEAFKKKVVELFPETMFADEFREVMGVFVKTAYESTAAIVREWGGQRYEKIASRIEKMLETSFDDMASLMVPVEPGAVLTHGDFWVNNMLFRYSNSKEAETGSGKPTEVKLLDFQIARYSSPASDLLYLMVSSTTARIRKEHWNDLLEHAYLGSFWKTLESLGHKDDVEEGIFSLDWLKRELKRLYQFAYMAAVTVTPAVMAESGEVPDLDSMTEDDLNGTTTNPFSDMYKGKLFQEKFRDLIDDFDEEGMFD